MKNSSFMLPSPGLWRPLVLTVLLSLCSVLVNVQAQASTVTFEMASVGSTYVPGDDDNGVAVTILQGNDLNFRNFDPFAAHSVTSDVVLSSGARLFDSGSVTYRGSALVSRAASLGPGVYGFHCNVHEDSMRGTLTVLAP